VPVPPDVPASEDELGVVWGDRVAGEPRFAESSGYARHRCWGSGLGEVLVGVAKAPLGPDRPRASAAARTTATEAPRLPSLSKAARQVDSSEVPQAPLIPSL
jgi:hypothetical protein